VVKQVRHLRTTEGSINHNMVRQVSLHRPPSRKQRVTHKKNGSLGRRILVVGRFKCQDVRLETIRSRLRVSTTARSGEHGNGQRSNAEETDAIAATRAVLWHGANITASVAFFDGGGQIGRQPAPAAVGSGALELPMSALSGRAHEPGNSLSPKRNA